MRLRSERHRPGTAGRRRPPQGGAGTCAWNTPAFRRDWTGPGHNGAEGPPGSPPRRMGRDPRPGRRPAWPPDGNAGGPIPRPCRGDAGATPRTAPSPDPRPARASCSGRARRRSSRGDAGRIGPGTPGGRRASACSGAFRDRRSRAAGSVPAYRHRRPGAGCATDAARSGSGGSCPHGCGSLPVCSPVPRNGRERHPEGAGWPQALRDGQCRRGPRGTGPASTHPSGTDVRRGPAPSTASHPCPGIGSHGGGRRAARRHRRTRRRYRRGPARPGSAAHRTGDGGYVQRRGPPHADPPRMRRGRPAAGWSPLPDARDLKLDDPCLFSLQLNQVKGGAYHNAGRFRPRGPSGRGRVHATRHCRSLNISPGRRTGRRTLGSSTGCPPPAGCRVSTRAPG